MKRRLLIIGAGGHARAVLDAALNSNFWDIEGIIDLSYRGVFEEVLTFPVLGGLEILDELDSFSTDIFVAIGSNQERQRIIEVISKYNFLLPTIVHPQAYVSSSAKMGRGTFIGAFDHIGPASEIGDGCIINTNANVEHEVILSDFVHMAPNSVVCGRSVVSKSVFIGANAAVIENLYIAEGVVIGAGSVVIGDIRQAGATVVGVPGRFV